MFGDGGNFKDCPTLYETLEKLRHIPIQHMDEEVVVQDVSSFFQLLHLKFLQTVRKENLYVSHLFCFWCYGTL